MLPLHLNKQYFLPLILVLACLAGPGTNYAQSSLYKDALALAKSDMDSVYLTFSCSCSDAVRMQLTDSSSNDVKVTILDPHLSTIIRTNKQGIDYFNLGSLDTIHISLGDSTVSLYSPNLAIDSVSFEPSDYLLEGVSLNLKKMDGTAFEAIKFGKGVKDIVADRAFRMASHSEFNKVNSAYTFSYSDLRNTFSDNPFVNWSDYFREGDEGLFRDIHIGPSYLGSSFTEELDLAYPYQRVIRGDSVLSLRNNISLAAVGIGYRQQIITAKAQLEAATGQFNQQRKKGELLDLNTIAVGLSDFIAERSQEELNLTFFNRFKKNLDKDSELTRLFPATKSLLYKFEISNYKTFLAHARETFNRDLDNLGTNLPGVLKLDKYKSLQDNPDIFNLALIYNIADLAYREYPVEIILLDAHRRLLDRQHNLNRSIDLAIADTLWRVGKFTATGRNTPLNTYRSTLLTYLDTILFITDCFDGHAKSLSRFMEQDLKHLIALELPPAVAYATSLSTFRKNPQSFLSYGDKFGMIELQDNLLEANRYLKAYSRAVDFEYESIKVQTGYKQFYEYILDNNLQGHEYYGWITDRSEPNDFELYFRNKPFPPFKYVARGLKYSRQFLAEDFEEGLETHSEFIEKTISRVEGIRRIRIKEENNQSTSATLAEPYETALDLLNQGISEEYFFWLHALNLDFFINRDLAGLQFLKNRSNSIIESKNFRYPLNSDDQRTQLAYITEVNGILDDLYLNVINQIDTLHRKYGDRISEYGEREFLNLKTSAYPVKKANPTGISISALKKALPKGKLEEYRQLRNTVIDGNLNSDLAVIAEFRQKLKKNKEDVIIVKQFRENLHEQLANFENTYAPQLVKARDNAQNLATAVELAIHLLFGFRNYDRVYDTLYYQDTQIVKVTVQKVDPITGFSSTFTKDSTVIVKTIVPGTEKAITNARWLTQEEFVKLRQDERAWNTFLGLLYQRMRSVKDAPDFSPEGIALLATQFLKAANEMEEHSNELRRKRAKDPESITFRDHYPTIRATVDLFNTIITAPAVGDAGETYSSKVPALQLIPTISNEALSLYENIYVKNYGSAILNATELLKIITERDLTREELAGMTKEERKKRASTLRNVTAIFRYGTFMAEMINAKSSDQVKTILKSTTLPPGSSRIKRETSSSITINAYLGAGVSQDRLLNAPSGVNTNALGIAASVPIGLTYSFSPWFLKNNSSFSIHTPIIDIGAITAYRSNPNGQTVNVDNFPELEWKNLFSPGAYLIYNLANSPFSIGFGTQYGPQLREINQANGEPIFLNSWRAPMGFISIDVPFYNLHTGPKKIRVR